MQKSNRQYVSTSTKKSGGAGRSPKATVVKPKTASHVPHHYPSSKRQRVYDVIHRIHMMRVNALAEDPQMGSIEASEIRDILKELKQKGLIYSPKPGFVDCVD